MKRIIITSSFIMAFLTASMNSDAANFDISAGIGSLNGYTTYRVGYPIRSDYLGLFEGYFPFSELKFPLEVLMGSLELSAEFAENYKASFNIQMDINDNAGEMEDSDWLTPDDPSRLDVYSTSDTTLDALIWDFNFQHRFYKTANWSFMVMLGYLRENFDFECRLIEQYSPSGLPGYDFVGDGSVGLIYEITYDIPYIGIETGFEFHSFNLNTSLAYSPFVNVRDKDQHVLRNKVNEGDLEGDAYLLSLEARQNFLKLVLFISG